MNSKKRAELCRLLDVLIDFFPRGFKTKTVIEYSEEFSEIKDAMECPCLGNIVNTNGLGMVLSARSRAKDPAYVVKNNGKKSDGYIFWTVYKRCNK